MNLPKMSAFCKTERGGELLTQVMDDLAEEVQEHREELMTAAVDLIDAGVKKPFTDRRLRTSGYKLEVQHDNLLMCYALAYLVDGLLRHQRKEITNGERHIDTTHQLGRGNAGHNANADHRRGCVDSYGDYGPDGKPVEVQPLERGRGGCNCVAGAIERSVEAEGTEDDVGLEI